MTPKEKNEMMEKIVRNLEQVYDPEIPTVSVLHLGLIYDIEIQNETVTITDAYTSRIVRGQSTLKDVTERYFWNGLSREHLKAMKALYILKAMYALHALYAK